MTDKLVERVAKMIFNESTAASWTEFVSLAEHIIALASSSVPEQDKPFNARLETDGILTPEGSYPDRIWFTPEDNSSAAYIRLDLHEAASSSVPEAPQQTYAEMIDRVMLAVCDPGCIVGYKGERSLNEWQRDALQVILPPPPEAPQDRGASQEGPTCEKCGGTGVLLVGGAMPAAVRCSCSQEDGRP